MRRLDHGHAPGHDAQMPTVSKSALKAKMLEYLREVERTGEELIITDNQRPVLKIVPVRKKLTAAEIFADVRGKVVYDEDIMTPLTDEWDDP
jgi:prevent-host-death family protein